MRKQLQANITVLSPTNPAICAAMFARAVAGQLVAVLRLKKVTSKWPS